MDAQPFSPVSDLHSDFDILSNMPSPVVSDFSDITAPSDDGKGPSFALLVKFLEIESKSAIRPVDMLPALDSFASIIVRLPGLVLDNNSYHVDRPLSKSDLKQLVSYTRRIGKFTLTDMGSRDQPKIAPETLSRLALLQDPESPLLPSLEHLRIMDADEALAHLFFCVTPSLKSLEISAIGPTYQITISYFLKELVLTAPRLSSVTLGPGRISESSLQSTLNFAHLRRLDLIDAAETLDFAFLRDASVLPELESFVIDARTAEYKHYLRPSNKSSSTPTSDRMGPPSTTQDEEPIVGSADQSTAPFRRLHTLTIVGNVFLMADIIYFLFPQAVKKISLTLVQSDQPLHLSPHWASTGHSLSGVPATDDAANQGSNGPTSDDVSPDSPTDAAHFPQVLNLEPTSSACQSVADSSSLLTTQDTVMDELDEPPKKRYSQRMGPQYILEWLGAVENAPKQEEPTAPSVIGKDYWLWDAERGQITAGEKAEEEAVRLRVEREVEEEAKRLQAAQEAKEAKLELERISNIVSQVLSFADLIEEILSAGSPHAFSVDYIEPVSLSRIAPLSSTPFEFPSKVLRSLLSCSTLKKLQFIHWSFTTVDQTFRDLTISPDSPLMSMEELKLPVDNSLNAGIAISTLRYIASYYPHLKWFECPVRVLPSHDVPNAPLGLKSEFVPHGLEVLSVGRGTLLPSGMEDKIAIATDLALLFPNLKAIVNDCGKRGVVQEDWKHINSLVRMCQTIRTDEKRRPKGVAI